MGCGGQPAQHKGRGLHLDTAQGEQHSQFRMQTSFKETRWLPRNMNILLRKNDEKALPRQCLLGP